jgi:general secretion pathway protein C
MQSNSQSIWWPRLAAFVLAGLAAASAVYWGLKWPGPSANSIASSVTAAASQTSDPQALARALGGGIGAGAPVVDLAMPGVGSRLALVGVVANGKNGGAALISVDGKPARPYRVGARVEDNLVLQSVGLRSASLAQSANSPANVTLEMPPLKK